MVPGPRGDARPCDRISRGFTGRRNMACRHSAIRHPVVSKLFVAKLFAAKPFVDCNDFRR
jgi:hypothetical protein